MATIRIRDYEPTDPRLGRKVRHDSRSRAFAFEADGAPLKDVSHTRYIRILDQGQLGSCTGNAAVGAVGSGVLYTALTAGFPTLPALDETEAVRIYSAATQLDDAPGQYPPTDTGSDGLSVAKVAKQFGFISGYQHAFSLAAFLAALQRQPVIVGTTWYESMFTPDASGRLTVDPSSGVAGGHEYVARQYLAAEQLIGFDNSWGESFGDHGTFWIHQDDFARLLADQGDATIFTPLTAPAPAPAPPVPADPFDRVIAGLRKVWAEFDAWLKRHGVQ